jgi:hypothetical protein
LILVGFFVFEIVRAAEVVLGAGVADGGEFVVAVYEKFDFALAPPARLAVLQEMGRGE